MMKDIVKAHYPDIDKKLLERALAMFYRIREIDDLRKKPSTSEFVDWINMLLHQGADLKKETSIPYIGSLLKSEDDLERFSK